MHRSERRGGRPRDLALFLTLLLGACGGGGDDDDGGGGGGQPQPLTFFTTNSGAEPTTPVAAYGTWLAFLVDEATTGPAGTDLNLDGDELDSVPLVVDTATQTEYQVPVAASAIEMVGTQLFAVVSEAADGLDWDADGAANDTVLLHWNTGVAPTYVDTLDPAVPPVIVAIDTTLFYASADAAAAPMESSLRAVASQAPSLPRPVFTSDMAGPLRPALLAEDEGLLLFGLSEVTENRDLNGDTDEDDLRVLALLDGTGTAEAGGYSFLLRSLGLAGRPVVDAPFRASVVGPNDWLVGVLVNEGSQGGVSLNDHTLPANGLPGGWLPSGCTMPDTDFLDDVLFFVRYQAWIADPLANAPTNTGFAGDERIVIAGDFVGTIVPEAAQTGCSLNGDIDLADRVFRWVRAERPLPVPPAATELLLAVDDLPGGTGGVAELSGRFVAGVVELAEGRDLDGDGDLLPGALIGWVDPAGGGWTFDHEPGEDFAFAVGTWMAETPGRERLGVAFAEESTGVDINGDGDVTDSIPTFPHFASDPLELLFPGFGAAVPPENPGIVIQEGHAFYRVSETLDDLDATGDGDLDDLVLWRSRLSDGATFIEAVLNGLDRPAVLPDDTLSPAFGAFLADESHAGDLNGDGNTSGHVLRYFGW